MRSFRSVGAALAVVVMLGAGVLAATSGSHPGRPETTPTPESVNIPAEEQPMLPPPNLLSDKVRLRNIKISGRNFTYCSNGSLETVSEQASRVVIAVHGNDRNACATAQTVLNAAPAEQRAHTLVVAPRFATVSDPTNPITDWVWTPGSWSQGDLAVGSTNPDASSFRMMDALLDRTNSRDQVLVGFSGGGQFVNRYAAMTSRNVQRFVIINPSTYLYFTPDRPGIAPDLLSSCPAYNDYRYGVAKRPAHLAGLKVDDLKSRYSASPVTYLLGDADNNPHDSSLDKSCGARAQGAERFERGRRYWDYLPTVLGPDIRQRHSLFVVRGVGHDLRGMVNSRAGQQAIYG